MKLAELIGIVVPLHGLLYSRDGTLTYFIKRFDRFARNKKIPIEDFAQHSNKDRETKYDSSIKKGGISYRGVLHFSCHRKCKAVPPDFV